MASIFCSLLRRVMPVGGALELVIVLIAIEGELSDPSQQMGRDLGQGRQQDGKIGPEMR